MAANAESHSALLADFWGDESGLRSDAQVGQGDAPRGQTPEIQPNTQRVGVNYIASISHQGKVRFMLYTRKLTAQVTERASASAILAQTTKLTECEPNSEGDW